jgi:hypothetical protein
MGDLLHKADRGLSAIREFSVSKWRHTPLLGGDQMSPAATQAAMVSR